MKEYYSGKPDENEEPERAPADVAERQASVPPNEADNTNEDDDEDDLLKAFENVDTDEDDASNLFGVSFAA